VLNRREKCEMINEEAGHVASLGDSEHLKKNII